MKIIIRKKYMFERAYTYDEMFNFIFRPFHPELAHIEVSDLIKCLRRYRTYLVGMEYLSNNTFSFSFGFNRRDFLDSFKEEIYLATKELPK